ncbi:extracellular solute-binding protein [Halogeometricum borinquense]|uniref:extracellular solute-binding protein n=1 Tax=Halogeometricum borinquense TaxID=60847 RepID=UPI0013EE247C|nr:extracellular solute-binding protein [Halogeometricum borinquense]
MSKHRRGEQRQKWSRLAGGRSRRAFLKAGGAAGVAALAGCSGVQDGGGTTTGATTGTASSMADSLTIFHAGSLEPPFSAAEAAFEDQYDVEVNREAKGSVASTKKITQQGRRADVLGVSDFRLIRNRVLPEYGKWYSIFTTNSMSIQYREDSNGAEDISTDNWWEVLSRDGVTIGHSDPAVDPGGYRAVMTQQLGAKSFDGAKLYDQSTYEKLRANSVVPTGTETNLEGQLKSGKLDYAIYYQSISSTSELPYIDLQPQVDLSKATSEYAEHYAKATVETDSETFTGAPIAYGITVPDVADAPNLGAKWVEFMLNGEGQNALEAKGLVPVEPAVVPKSGADAVPSNVMEYATAKSTLGPMEL